MDMELNFNGRRNPPVRRWFCCPFFEIRLPSSICSTCILSMSDKRSFVVGMPLRLSKYSLTISMTIHATKIIDSQPSVSLTLPKTQQKLFPFSNNMLSEGRNRIVQSRMLHIDENDHRHSAYNNTNGCCRSRNHKTAVTMNPIAICPSHWPKNMATTLRLR